MSPPPDSFPLGEKLVPHRDQVEKPAPDEDPEEGLHKPHPHDKDSQQEKHRDARQRDHVGNDLVVEIDEGDDDEDRREKEGSWILKAQTVLPEHRPGKQGRQDLDQGIPGRDGLAAVPAPAPQDQPAQHGDVVVRADGFAAFRAVGGRKNDGFPLGYPPDADIEKTADHGPEDERNNVQEYSHSLISRRAREPKQKPAVQKWPDARPPKSRGLRRTGEYAAGTRDEGNAETVFFQLPVTRPSEPSHTGSHCRGGGPGTRQGRRTGTHPSGC